LGAHFVEGTREYAELVAAEGFRLERRDSVVARGVELGLVPMPRWLLATVYRGLRDGYAIGSFASA
jgi:hypothetical protein